MCLVAMVPSGIIKCLCLFIYFFEDSFVILIVCVCARESGTCMLTKADAQRPGVSDLPGAIGRGGCELPDLHAKN